MAITFRHAGAGSGKTFSIEQDIGDRLADGRLRPDGLIAVTFTNRAADELLARIGAGLPRRGRPDLAALLDQALIGTVNSVCGRLLQAHCFDLGLSPAQRVIAEQDKQVLFNEAMDLCLDGGETAALNATARRLSLQDWQAEVQHLVDSARSNNFAAADLARFAEASVAELLAVLPAADPTVDEAGLRAALEKALRAARKVVKPTKALRESIEKMDGWRRAEILVWEDWVRASKLSAGVKELPLLDPAKAHGAQVLKCPRLRADVEALIRGLFGAAARVMDAFAQLKARRGLIDFVDQEHLMLRALGDAGVLARLRPRLGLLVVDEFQDSSPIQLALFARLASLADEVLFVGDAKQAIYGFRGSDPRLCLDVIAYVRQGGGRLENLGDSWRSRPGLVHLANELFTQPFAHLLTPEQVRLRPRLDPPLDREELGWWRLDGSNQVARAQALALGLRELATDGSLVWDKTLEQPRPVAWRDIAVLCFSNGEAAALAAACALRGVPTGYARVGLVETPEVTLALACLRRLADATDTAAAAEILSLEGGVDAEAWLGERLEAFGAGGTGAYTVNHASAGINPDTLPGVGARDDWADTISPLLRRLAATRADIGRLSPAEALSSAILAADLHRVVIGWDESARLTEHRLANLARLAELAQEYGDHCRAQHHAGTVAGLILWLRSLEQQFTDEQAPNPGNSISILTYHGAKGLEWPIVVCTSLDKDLKVSLYGLRVLASGAPFDWHAPLAGRALRYWPDPFPAQQGRDPLTNCLRVTPAWADATAQARNEAIQLLYVGLTRARDRLILTGKPKAQVGKWLELLESPLFPPDGDVLNLPNGVSLATRVATLDGQSAAHPGMPRARYWLPHPAVGAGAGAAVGDFFAPPHTRPPLAAPVCTLVHDFAKRISLTGTPDMATLGEALHHALALALANPGLDGAAIQAILDQYPDAVLDAGEVLDRARDLARWLANAYPGARLHGELPFSRPLPTGQMQSGQIDLALELADGWVIVDHKSNPQPKAEWPRLAAKHSGQLAAYADALASLGGKPVRDTLIHFSISGGLVRVSR